MPETEDQPTEAERKDTQRSKGTTADMARALDPILYPHLNPLMQDWPRLMQITRQVRTVFVTLGWVRPEEAAAREAAARREALLEAAEELDALPSYRSGRGFMYSHETDFADGRDEEAERIADWLRALAEPERDEEGGR